MSEKRAIFRTNKYPESGKTAMPRADSPNSIDTQIVRRVLRSARGTVFTPAMFASIGSRAAIDKALQRLIAQGVLRRLSRDLYDKPREDEMIGRLWPAVDTVVKAVIGKDKIRVQPTGAYAANLLGLSEQVPVKVVFLTDGASRSIKAGPIRIVLKRTSPRNMATAGRTSGLVIQALRWLGKDHVNQDVIKQLRVRLNDDDKKQLIADFRHAPIWIAEIMREISGNPGKQGK